MSTNVEGEAVIWFNIKVYITQWNTLQWDSWVGFAGHGPTIYGTVEPPCGDRIISTKLTVQVI